MKMAQLPARGTQITIGQELAAKKAQFQAALAGTGISHQKFIRIVMTAINLNPDLLNCDRRSLMNAALRAAGDGLVPDGFDGALVPFDGKVTWMPMIAGIRKKVRRTGEVTAWDVVTVSAKDNFDYQLGDNPFIHHKPWNPPFLERNEDEDEDSWRKRLRQHVDRGPMTHVYSVATLRGGDKSRDVMSRIEVELVRDEYARKNRKGEFSPAWRKSFDEMAKKTVARRHAKQLPMSSDIIGLLTRDDELYNVRREDEHERVQAPRELSARLDFLSGVDPGELTESSEQGASTPPVSDERAVSHDVDPGIGAGSIEETAQAFPFGAEPHDDAEERDEAYSPETRSAAPTPPEAEASTPLQQAPASGGSQVEQEGEKTALRGRRELEQWVKELSNRPDDLAHVTLAQLKAWRAVADKVPKA